MLKLKMRSSTCKSNKELLPKATMKMGFEIHIGKPLGSGMHARVCECTTSMWPVAAIKLPISEEGPFSSDSLRANRQHCLMDFRREWKLNEILTLAATWLLAFQGGEDELEAMRMHPGYKNIIQCFRFYTQLDKGTPALLMERCTDVTLQKYMRENEILYDTDQTMHLFKAVFAGIRYMAYCGSIRHRDIHWCNLMRGQDGHWKFIDYGAATMIQSEDVAEACTLDITAFVQTLFVNMSSDWVYTFNEEKVPHLWGLLYELAFLSQPAFFQSYKVPEKQHARVQHLQSLLFTPKELQTMECSEQCLQQNAIRTRHIERLRAELPEDHYNLDELHRVTLTQRGYRFHQRLAP